MRTTTDRMFCSPKYTIPTNVRGVHSVHAKVRGAVAPWSWYVHKPRPSKGPWRYRDSGVAGCAGLSKCRTEPAQPFERGPSARRAVAHEKESPLDRALTSTSTGLTKIYGAYPRRGWTSLTELIPIRSQIILSVMVLGAFHLEGPVQQAKSRAQKHSTHLLDLIGCRQRRLKLFRLHRPDCAHGT